jgi:hypothetical protein
MRAIPAVAILNFDSRASTFTLRFAPLAAALLLSSVAVRAAEPAPKTAPEFTVVPARGPVTFEPGDAEITVPEHFRLDRHEFEYQARPVYGGNRFRMLRVTFPSPVTTDVVDNNTVHAEYFQPAGPGPYPACVVLHILGGDFLLAETVASHLARHGVAALFVKMPYYGTRRRKDSPKRMLSEDPRETVAGMTQAVLDIRRATAWLAQREEVDPERLGITGISLGGIMSALAAAGEPRLTSIAIVLGGGNFAAVSRAVARRGGDAGILSRSRRGDRPGDARSSFERAASADDRSQK